MLTTNIVTAAVGTEELPVVEVALEESGLSGSEPEPPEQFSKSDWTMFPDAYPECVGEADTSPVLPGPEIWPTAPLPAESCAAATHPSMTYSKFNPKPIQQPGYYIVYHLSLWMVPFPYQAGQPFFLFLVPWVCW